jgi:hypothetical protein
MKEMLWIGIRGEKGLHFEMCTDFVHNSPPNSRWYNPNFTRELERETNELRGLHPNLEFLLLRDMNSLVGTLQVNLPHSWETD